MANDKVSVEITIEEKQALKALTKLTKNVDGLEKETVSSVKKMDSAFASFAGNLAANAVGKAFQVAGRAVGAFTDTIFESIQLANAQEDAIKKLDVALIASGITSKEVSRDFQEFASSLQRVTKFGDEAILENAALIQSLGQLDQKGLKTATKAALDLSSALGVSLNSAAILVGKAAAGEVGSFSRYGLIIKKGADNAETFSNALKGINDKFGGAARAQVDTFSGSVEQLGNSWGDAKEEIGFAFTKNEDIKLSIKELNALVINLGSDIARVAPDIVKSFTSMAKFVTGFFLDTEADSRFASHGIDGLRVSIGTLEGRLKGITNNTFNLPEMLIGDSAEVSKKLELYKSKLAEVTAGEKNLVELRKGSADFLTSVNESIFGRSEFVTEDSGAAGEDGRVIKEKEVSALILKQRTDFAAQVAILKEEEKIKKQESILAEKDLEVGDREVALENLKSYTDAKINVELSAALDKNSKIKDIEAKGLADEAANLKASIAQQQNAAKLEAALAAQKIKDKQSFFAKATSLSQSSSKELAAIGKAAGLVQIAQATPPAIASSYRYGTAIGGPILGATFGAIAFAAQAEQAKKMAGFAGGGVIGGFSGATSGNDNTTVKARTGEMFLNASEQRTLFDIASGGSPASSGGQIIEITSIVQVDEREIARSVRNQRLEGFAS